MSLQHVKKEKATQKDLAKTAAMKKYAVAYNQDKLQEIDESLMDESVDFKTLGNNRLDDDIEYEVNDAQEIIYQKFDQLMGWKSESE